MRMKKQLEKKYQNLYGTWSTCGQREENIDVIAIYEIGSQFYYRPTKVVQGMPRFSSRQINFFII